RRFPKSPHADSILQKLGMIYLNNDQHYQKAIDTYQRLFEKYPESKYRAQSLFMIGYIYANYVKNFDKAKEAYTSFLEKYPEHELVTSVKWEIDHLGKDISEIDIFASSKDGQTASEKPGAPTAKPATSGPKVKP
ncbi:MAG: tetratricopeptide repeat protein, partial [candidate division KSB1 bacterium]|nr:tetratricopeptide repeat protein [candidate division KSB1 bacterium]